MIVQGLFLLLTGILIRYIYIKKNRKSNFYFKGKKVLILGGSSGLGLSIGKLILEKGAIVSIASRNINKLVKAEEELNVKIIQVDATNIEEIDKLEMDYDIIFSCVGKSIPNFIADQKMEEIKDMIETNFIATVNIIKKCINSKKPPKCVVLVASSLSLYSLPGYEVYSSTKSALKSLFESVKFEMRTIGTELKIYFVSTIYTPGYCNENITKPKITSDFESPSLGSSCEPENRAKKLVDGMLSRNRIHSDTITYLLMINEECELFIDYFCLPIATVFNQIFKCYQKSFFKNMKTRK